MQERGEVLLGADRARSEEEGVFGETEAAGHDLIDDLRGREF
jgi:hypothetical protein